jgi:hypothetical protein
MGYFRALVVLTRKNFLLAFRDRNSLIVQFLATFLALLLLFGVQKSFDSNGGFLTEAVEDRTPVIKQLNLIPRCTPFNFDDCITIAYAPDTPLVAGYVDTVARNNKIPNSEVQGFASSAALNEHLFFQPNRTQGAYIFEKSDLALLDKQSVSFIIQINTTGQTIFPIGATNEHQLVVAPMMLHHMNNVIMKDLGQPLDITLSSSVMPHPTLEYVESAFVLYGSAIMFSLFFISFVLFLYKIVDEKERGAIIHVAISYPPNLSII